MAVTAVGGDLLMVTIERNTQLGATSFRLEFSSDLGGTPTFYMYRDGQLIEASNRTWVQVELQPNETVQFDILDDVDALPAQAWPSRALLTWYAVDGAAKYRVQEYVGATWTQRALLDAAGKGYFRWESRVLEDGQVHQFRVAPVSESGIDGVAREFSFEMIRRPDVPAMTQTYNDDGTITYEAA